MEGHLLPETTNSATAPHCSGASTAASRAPNPLPFLLQPSPPGHRTHTYRVRCYTARGKGQGSKATPPCRSACGRAQGARGMSMPRIIPTPSPSFQPTQPPLHLDPNETDTESRAWRPVTHLDLIAMESRARWWVTGHPPRKDPLCFPLCSLFLELSVVGLRSSTAHNKSTQTVATS
jgi:hypothetical protein